MSTLDKAILIATQAHQDQKDRYDKAYILHPIRLMMKMDSEQEQIAAILHDVVEDSEWTFDDLYKEGFSGEIITAVDCLTKRDNEPYMDYIERLKSNTIARKVKLADLEDNMDLRRIDKVSEKDMKRLERYHQAWKLLRAYEA
jgi:guanosine-3',5'-bis(diphosphate) 3'-pyrophosphohydrolase